MAFALGDLGHADVPYVPERDRWALRELGPGLEASDV